MIVENFLLPRFLILELVFACHYLQFTRACTALCSSESNGYEGIVSKETMSAGDGDKVKRHKKVFKKLTELKQILLSPKQQNEIHEADKALTVKESKSSSVMKPNSSVKKSLFLDGFGALGLQKILKEKSVSCEVSLEEQGWKYAPLMYNESGKLILPLPGYDFPVINVMQGERIILSCPGNTINNTRAEQLKVQCVIQDRFHFNKSVNDIDQLGCKKNPKEVERLIGKLCGPENSGQISKLGFKYGHDITPLITACRSTRGEVTYYTNHTVHGNLLRSKMVAVSSRNFKEGGLYFGNVSADKVYMQASQKHLFLKLFGPVLSKKLLNVKQGLFLARGHLAPSGDLLLTVWQDVSFMFSNVVPQWQSINNGNWADVEHAVRERAISRKSTLKVFTGTFDILSLMGKELWLDHGNIPVPKYLWKLVVDANSGESITFVTLNNPHLRYLTRSVAICSDICDLTGWGVKLRERHSIDQGFTRCCDTVDLKEKIPWLPIVNISGLLNF